MESSPGSKIALDELYQYALSLYGVSYQWGGSGPDGLGNYGYDCSGYVEAILRRGKAPAPAGRLNSQQLYDYFSVKGIPAQTRGSLAFFGTLDRVSHVGWMIDPFIMISAASGGSWCTNRTLAASRNAFVKIQPIAWYKAPPFLGSWMPLYPGIV